jgi:hypothetical protein
VNKRFQVYVFRDGRFARGGSTVVSAAPHELVTSVYGGGGLVGEGNLAAVFGGCAYFRNDETGLSYLGIWGARKASKFRSSLCRSGASVELIPEPPPARLLWFKTGSSIAISSKSEA